MRTSSSSRRLRRLALLALDVAGVAKLADDAVRLFVGQRSKRVRNLGEHVRAGVSEVVEVEVGALHQPRDRRLLVQRRRSLRSQASVSRSGSARFRRIRRPLHARDARSTRRLRSSSRMPSRSGDRRQALVDGVAAEEQAVLRAGGEHPIRLLGAERDEVVDHDRRRRPGRGAG